MVDRPAVVAHVARVSLLPSFRLLPHNLQHVPIILLFKHTCMGIQAELSWVLLAHLSPYILLILGLLRYDGIVGICSVLTLVVSLLQNHHVLLKISGVLRDLRLGFHFVRGAQVMSWQTVGWSHFVDSHLKRFLAVLDGFVFRRDLLLGVDVSWTCDTSEIFEASYHLHRFGLEPDVVENSSIRNTPFVVFIILKSFGCACSILLRAIYVLLLRKAFGTPTHCDVITEVLALPRD